MNALQWLESLGVDLQSRPGEPLEIRSPIDGQVIASVNADTAESADRKVQQAAQAFAKWRTIPAPKRGELIRLLGEALREHKEELGQLVTLESGKIIEEGRGEVQEMIDTRCPKPGTRLARSGLSVRLIFQWRCGAGTLHWQLFAGIPSSGNHRKKHR
jgi:hypothetical protein